MGELEELVAKLKRKSVTPLSRSQNSLGQRQALTASLFGMLLQSSSMEGGLGLRELRQYADFCGFNGNDLEWAEEYRSLQRKYGWPSGEGAGLEHFEKLVGDKAGNGYCTLAELKELTQKLRRRSITPLRAYQR